MTPDRVTVESALSDYREVLRVDGADLELDTLEADGVRLRLVVGPDTCSDCILDRSMLETILLDVLQEADPSITRVVVDDPRTTL